MLSMSELKIGVIIEIENEPYVIQSTQHIKMGRGGAILRTKIKNLISNNVLEKTFKNSDKIKEASLEKSKANFLYKDENNIYLMNNLTYEQFSFSISQIRKEIFFLKEGQEVEILNFNNQPVSVKLPPKIVLEITDAPLGIKGDSATGACKVATCETGLQINVPLFVKQGDKIRIKTDTGEYVEKA
jgi:elongation factor P